VNSFYSTVNFTQTCEIKSDEVILHYQLSSAGIIYCSFFEGIKFPNISTVRSISSMPTSFTATHINSAVGAFRSKLVAGQVYRGLCYTESLLTLPGVNTTTSLHNVELQSCKFTASGIPIVTLISEDSSIIANKVFPLYIKIDSMRSLNDGLVYPIVYFSNYTSSNNRSCSSLRKFVTSTSSIASYSPAFLVFQPIPQDLQQTIYLNVKYPGCLSVSLSSPIGSNTNYQQQISIAGNNLPTLGSLESIYLNLRILDPKPVTPECPYIVSIYVRAHEKERHVGYAPKTAKT
jgi:hypothetical protein